MAEVMNSLFGITPESLMAQREKQAQQEAMAYAQLQDPFARANYQIYKGASGLGSQLAGMFGAQDPEMQRLTQRQTLLKQAQPQDAAGWQALAQQLYASGDTPGAQEALAKSQALQSVAIKQGLDTSTMASNLATAAGKQFDISPEGRGQELAKTGKFTSESIKNFIEGKGQLEAIDKFTKPSADFVAKAVEFGFGDKPSYGGYTPEQTAKINSALFQQDITKKKAGAPKTTVEVKQEESVTKSNVEAFGSLRDKGIQAGKTLEAVRTITPLIDKSFAGFGSDSKLTAGQIAEALGVPIQGTSETEQMRSLQSNLKIGNSTVLKGNLSDKDMGVVAESIGQGTVTKSGLKGIMRNIEKDAMIDQIQYQKANKYQQEGKLSKYDFVKGSEEARSEVNSKMKRLSELERKARGQ